MSIYKEHYVYRITNIFEGRHYYGSRTSKNGLTAKEELGFKYFSSSSDKEFLKDQKNFPEKYSYKVVFISETRERATQLEEKLHKIFNVGINEMFYNKHIQSSKGASGYVWNDESKERMSLKMSGEDNPMFGKTGKLCHNFGLIRSEETKSLISKNHADLSRERNPFYGKTHSEESIKKMKESLSLKITCPYCNHTSSKSIMTMYHFEKCKLFADIKFPEDTLIN